jgi:hypothetical protein
MEFIIRPATCYGVHRNSKLEWTKGKVYQWRYDRVGRVDLLDVDGSGIKCLRVQLVTEDETSRDEFKTSTFPYVTYGWDRTEYGFWLTVRQIPEENSHKSKRKSKP